MDLVEQAVKLIRSGDDKAARTILLNALRFNPDNLDAWFWLAAVTEDLNEREACLERVLILEPDHPAARKGLCRSGA